jgi:hypothetical protein
VLTTHVEGCSGSSRGPTSAAGRHDRGSNRAKLTLHGPCSQHRESPDSPERFTPFNAA